MNSGSRSMAASVTSKVSSPGGRRSGSALLEGLGQHLLAGEHREERGQPLLAVDDKQLRRPVPLVHPDLPRADVGAGLPEHQRADRIAAVHRVEEIPRLGRRPHERPLDVGQADPAA